MAPKNTTDPVADARSGLDQAQRAADQARAELESYKDRILAGDTTVSPADYADAAHAAEHADLAVQGAAIAVQAAERDARLRTLQDLRAEILATTGTPDDALNDWRALAAAAERIVTRCAARQRNITTWTNTMRRHLVPERTVRDTPDPQHAGLGWSRATMGNGDSIHVDTRRIQSIDPGMLIASAAYTGARAAGVTHLRLTSNEQLATDPDRWFRAHY